MIRKFKKEDAKHVASLIKQLTSNIVKPDSLEKRLEEIVEDNNTQYFVAEIDNKIVGFAGLCWYTIPSKGLMAWVEELIVDEKIRGKGIGKSLMNELINLAHEIKCNKMELTVNNPIAISLYEKLGFEFTNSKVMIKKHY
ncbi:GNAT family N-acetyltransferase [bacterium]|jgi:N-acetylglutamate synthase-like GNAT family acetyltransferase|nr:GNAT family N-acetyltransferase [bacterium]MBT4335617.1 GNAT family N-acetyltransferase [bacterium]MBT4495189.1 GNAT family N-acetyltransferase [bacterium]MBT4763688.1 GNAT family N-acetyltransferase [bacterium]MBT5401059.1 GNAT family N-acetyltransferase [bacterium]